MTCDRCGDPVAREDALDADGETICPKCETTDDRLL
jgi:formylmethanofuran dehydrogenase subunit E